MFVFFGHIFMPPLKKVKLKLKPLFSAQCVVSSISFDLFTWSIPNLVQGLTSMSRLSLSIFRAHVQRSKSNYSSKPSVLSTILIPCLLALDRFCFYREDKPEFCTMGGIYVSETFLVWYRNITYKSSFMSFKTLCLSPVLTCSENICKFHMKTSKRVETKSLLVVLYCTYIYM